MRTIALLLTLCSTAALTLAAVNRPKIDLRGHAGGIIDLAVHPDGEHLLSISTEPGIFIWSLKTGRQVGSLQPIGKTVDRDTTMHALGRRVEAIAISPDGKHVAEAVVEGGQGRIRIWDFARREIVRTFPEDARNARDLVYSPDGKLIAVNMREGLRADHKISLLDAETGKEVGAMRGDRLAATMLAFSPDGKTLVSAGGRVIHVWDVATRKQRHMISTHRKLVLDLAFSPDDKHFVTSDEDDEVRIWDAEEGKLVGEIEHKQSAVHSVAYSGSGRTIATGGKDGTIKLWSTKGRHRETLWGHADRVTVLEFGTRNKHLASGSRDGIIGWWEFDEPAQDDEDEENPLDDENWRDLIDKED